MIRGWCPTVHAPMPSGDGLLARVKPFGGRLPPAALAALVDAVAANANGTVELTGRGNLQIRGVHDPAAFARAMVAAGLADPDPVREARRNVTALPPYDDGLVAAVEAVLADTPGLPPKFSVAVRGPDILVADAVVHTIGELRQALAGASRSPILSDLHLAEILGGTLLYLPFGQTTAAQLATLTAEIRTTPWRAFFSPIRVPGFLDAPSPITACPGGPACASGTVPARADAASLRTLRVKHLHISGCAKGCAYPAATATLVGRNGAYDIVRHGRAHDRPDLTGLTLAQAVAAL